MKPLGFQLDEMRALLTVLDPPENAAESTAEQCAQPRQYCETAEQRCTELCSKQEMAEEVAVTLHASLEHARPVRTTAACRAAARAAGTVSRPTKGV